MNLINENIDFEYSGKEMLNQQKILSDYNDYIFRQFKNIINDHDNVLDFGAGIGTFAELVNKKKINLECVEKDSSQKEHLRKKGFICYTKIPEKNSYYDMIYSINVLEHIKDDQVVLRKLHDIIKQNGYLVLWVPAFQFLYSSFDKRVGHLRRYSKKGMIQKLRNSGYTIKLAKYQDSIGWGLSILYKLFGSRKGKVDMKILVFFNNTLLSMSILFDKVLGSIIGKNLIVIAKKSD